MGDTYDDYGGLRRWIHVARRNLRDGGLAMEARVEIVAAHPERAPEIKAVAETMLDLAVEKLGPRSTAAENWNPDRLGYGPCLVNRVDPDYPAVRRCCTVKDMQEINTNFSHRILGTAFDPLPTHFCRHCGRRWREDNGGLMRPTWEPEPLNG